MADDEEPSVEAAFSGHPPPPWWRQVTVRSVVASLVLGPLLSLTTMRLGLTAGLVPSFSFNASAGLLSLFAVSGWTRLLALCGVSSRPFNRQENAVVQTCISASSILSLYGGFMSYVPAMTAAVARSMGDPDGGQVLEPHPLKLMAFIFLTSFSSLLCTLPLTRIMIVDYKLTYPAGVAIAGIFNSFHGPSSSTSSSYTTSSSPRPNHMKASGSSGSPRPNHTKASGSSGSPRPNHTKASGGSSRRSRALLRTLVGTFAWDAFQWIYTAGRGCGFRNFPLFGLTAYREHRFYFDFSPSLVGVGMLCPPLISFSLLFGAVVSSWIVWPMLARKQGDWFTDPSPSSFSGINGYKVPMGVSLVLADGLFQLLVLLLRFPVFLRRRRPAHKQQEQNHHHEQEDEEEEEEERCSSSYDERRRMQVFQIPVVMIRGAVAGYVLLAAVSTALVPRIFPQLRYHHVALCYAAAPLLAFCNSYASGLTNMSVGNAYGKLAILIFGAWVGRQSGGEVAGLVACGVVLLVIGNAAELMQNFRTGYLTLTSPVAMFAGQVVGTAIGCVANPFLFFALQKMVGVDQLGQAGTLYQAPMAAAYRGIAQVSVQGVKALPRHSVQLCAVCFSLALCVDCLALLANTRNWRLKGYIPNVMAAGLPFLVGPMFAVDMTVGSLLLILWRRTDRQAATTLSVVVASGLICGDGLWALPAALLSNLDVHPPICMKFLSSYQTAQMEKHLTL